MRATEIIIITNEGATPMIANEGWKDTLTNLGAAGALALAGTGGLELKKALSPPAEPPAMTRSAMNKEPVINKKSTAAKPTVANPTVAKPADDMKKVTTAPATSLRPKPRPTDPYFTDHPNERLLYQIATNAGLEGTELASFMSQMAHESHDFSDMVENNPNIRRYSSGKLANLLGNRNSNDAARFIGRGFIQLTGRWNYKWMQDELGIDLTSTWSAAHRAADPKIAAKIAVIYWKKRVRPDVSDFSNVKAVTKAINPGLHGLEQRRNDFKNFSRHYQLASAS